MQRALVVVCLALAPLAHAQNPTSPASSLPSTHWDWPPEWPIVPTPARGPLPPSPLLEAGPAPTRAGGRALEVIAAIHRNLRETSYRHALAVNERSGTYHWDCSLMVSWVLRRAAPRSLAAIGNVERPLAVHYVRAIERAPVGRFQGGWQRLSRIEEVQPGDVFAWRRPEGFPSNNSGHVGFVLSRATPVPGIPGGWAVRIADSTRSAHQNDTRPWPGNGGFGIGTLVFLADPQGHGTHYGWAGTYSEGYVVTPILFGRIGP
jgi:hypothetical protein